MSMLSSEEKKKKKLKRLLRLTLILSVIKAGGNCSNKVEGY